MPRALIALGSNLGDRRAALDAAAAAVGQLPLSRLIAKSAWFHSTAVGGPPDQPAFLNGALVIETAMEPQELLDHLQRIEREAGRVRGPRWGPRTLDLDLLLYDERSIATDQLRVPHPRMVFRRFVLEPAAQIAAEMMHPATGMTVAQLLKNMDHTPPYLALVGPPGCGKTRLARELARQSGCRLLLDPGTDTPGAAAGSSAPRDSAGRELTREIEFLTRRARLLGLSRDQTTWAVSDFWLPQSLAWAEAEGPESLRSQVESACQELQQGALVARFVAALDVMSPPDIGSPTGSCRNDFDARLRVAIKRLVSQRGQPPVVWLSSDDWNRSVAELMAVLSG